MTKPDRIIQAVSKVQAVISGWPLVDAQNAVKLLRREAAYQRAMVRRIVQEMNATKYDRTTIVGDNRIIFLNGYNKATCDLLAALTPRRTR